MSNTQITRLPVEPLETRFLLSATAAPAPILLPVPAFSEHSFATLAIEKLTTYDLEFVHGVEIYGTSAHYGHVEGMPGRLGPAMDRDGGSGDGLINHFSPGEGSGAPQDADEYVGHDRSAGMQKSSDYVSGKFSPAKDARVSTAWATSDQDVPPDPPQYVVSGGTGYRIKEIIVVGSQPPTDAGRGYFTATRPEVSPADATQQRAPARGARAGNGENVIGRGLDQLVAAPQVKPAESVMTAVRDNGVVHTVLNSTNAGARTLVQAATPFAETARVAPAIFATAVVAHVDRNSIAAIMTAAAEMRALGSSQLGEASASIQQGTGSTGETSGAIVVAQALLRLLRNFAGTGPSAAADAPAVGSSHALETDAQNGWDVPMFMSANLLGLAPGSPWMTAVQNSGQRTLRWVAGVSLLITVAGCYYCVAITARARRAALDEGLESTLQFTP